MRKVAKYRRVSHQEQKLYGLSIQAQDMELEKWAKENNVVFVGDYVDEGISATTIKRPALQRLLEDVQSGEIDLIVFTKLDRWFRSVSQYYRIQDILDRSKVAWRAIQEDYNTETADGRLKVNIMLSVAQNEVDKTSERIKAVFKYKLANGEAITGAQPYGYIIDENKKPAIDPNRKHITELIFKHYLETNHLRETFREAKKLDPKITYKTVRTTLVDEKYTGYYKDIPNYYPPYISWNDHKTIVEAIKKNVKTNRAGRTFLFTRLIHCPNCNRILGGQYCSPNRYGEYYLYRCNAHRQDKNCDFNAVVNEVKVEAALLKHIKTEFQEYLLAEEVAVTDESELDPKEIQSQMDRLNNMYFKGRLSEELYETEYNKLENLLKSVEQKPNENKSTEIILSNDFETIYESMNRDERRSFWRGIIKSMVVHPKLDYKIDIDFY